jgi:hypothetical protein
VAIESICTECGKQLRVGDEYAGQRARCPSCGNIYTVPRDDGAPSESDSPDQAPLPTDTNGDHVPGEVDRWFMQTPEGRVYGPVSRSQLDQWVREGRVDEDCQLRLGEQSPWQWASQVYGILGYAAAPEVGPGNPFAGGQMVRPDEGPGRRATQQTGYVQPHRGGLVLALGILAWAISCPILGIAAWWLGNEDLRTMAQGRMDSSGRGVTQAGRVLGMINSLLWIALITVMFFCFALAVVLRAQ